MAQLKLWFATIKAFSGKNTRKVYEKMCDIFGKTNHISTIRLKSIFQLFEFKKKNLPHFDHYFTRTHT